MPPPSIATQAATRFILLTQYCEWIH